MNTIRALEAVRKIKSILSLRRISILLRATKLSWMVTAVAITIFASSIIPYHRASLLDSLHSKAQLVSASIAELGADESLAEPKLHQNETVEREIPSAIAMH